jgi:PKD repeat protein
MKHLKAISIVIIIIICLVIAGYFYYPTTSKEKLETPEAKIEIKKVEAGELVINQGQMIFFSAMNSSDKDGKIESYYWDFDDGNSSASVDPVHKYDEPGIYFVTLTVIDNDGKKNVTSIQITVINSKPVAALNIQNNPSSSNQIPVYYTIQFNSSKSYDLDGSIVKWLWDFGDGNTIDVPNPKYTYEDTGDFTVSLTVHDDNDDIATDSIDLEIILRTYEIKWTLEETEKVIEPNGYTREGESSVILDQLDDEYIASVNILLNWTDLQPLLKNNQTQGEDLFELNLLTPENISKIENSSSGSIDITITYLPQLNKDIYDAKTANEAITTALKDAGFDNEGMGEWYYNVTAIECKGGNWNNDIFDLDIGNFWSLKIIIYYYSFEITDTTF